VSKTPFCLSTTLCTINTNKQSRAGVGR